jgi:hypothetical protein
MVITAPGLGAMARNTKVERVVEAIENLSIVTAHATMSHTSSAMSDVKDAREEAATALREFLQPTLRVVGGNDAYR